MIMINPIMNNLYRSNNGAINKLYRSKNGELAYHSNPPIEACHYIRFTQINLTLILRWSISGDCMDSHLPCWNKNNTDKNELLI